MSFLQRFARIYIYGNIHISIIGAIAFYQINMTHSSRIEESVMVAMMIFIYYNLSQIISIKKYENIKGNSELEWTNRNMTEIIFAMLFSLFSFLVLYYPLCDRSNLLSLIEIVFIGTIYFFLKKIPILKNLLIGVAWAMMLRIFDHYHLPSDFYLALYFSVISFFYDKVLKIEYKFSLDLLILIPFVL